MPRSAGGFTIEEHAQVLAAKSRLDGWVPPEPCAASGGPCTTEDSALGFPTEARDRKNAEHQCGAEQDDDRPDRRRERLPTPHRRVEAVDRPACRHDERHL